MSKFSKTEAGYSLVSTASMLVILGFGSVAGISLYKQNESQKKTQANKEIQSSIKHAMESFRAKNGRYPCPAPMNAAIDTAAFGKEIGNNCVTAPSTPNGTWNTSGRGGRGVEIGAVPTRTLNIDDKLSVDAYGSKIIYAVTESYAAPSAPFNQDLGAISIRDPNGNNITSVPGNAIYTLVLPGSDKRGVYSLSGTIQQPCDAGSQAGENCDNNDAIFISNSFIRDAETNQKFTAMLGFESSNQAFYWDVGGWTAPACPTSCGQPASPVNINRTVTCRVVGTNAVAPNTLCPQNPVLQTVSVVNCPSTAACPTTTPTGGGGGGGGGGSDGDGQSYADLDGDGMREPHESVPSHTPGARPGTGSEPGRPCCGSPGSGGGGGGGGGGCFVAGTMVKMADGTEKAIETIALGDNVLMGGRVITTAAFLVSEIYDYKGVIVSGSHAVFEDGKWLRVRDAKHAVLISDDIETAVYVHVNENHRIIINDIVFADFQEVSYEYSPHLQAIDDSHLKILNGVNNLV